MCLHSNSATNKYRNINMFEQAELPDLNEIWQILCRGHIDQVPNLDENRPQGNAIKS